MLYKLHPDNVGVYDEYGNRYLVLTPRDYGKALAQVARAKMLEILGYSQ